MHLCVTDLKLYSCKSIIIILHSKSITSKNKTPKVISFNLPGKNDAHLSMHGQEKQHLKLPQFYDSLHKQIVWSSSKVR